MLRTSANEMTIAKEEIIGPVLSILTYRDDEEAVRLANGSGYCLHAYVFSSNVPRANAVAARLEAGRVMMNTLQNDALAPLGGLLMQTAKASLWINMRKIIASGLLAIN